MKQGKKLKDVIAHIIVSRGRLIVAIFVVLVVLSLFFSLFVEVKYDLTKYLPGTVQSKQGIDLMEEEFGYPGTARVMIDNVSLYEAKQYKDKIETVEGVDMVTWLDSAIDIYQSENFINYEDIEEYYKDGYSVMDIVFDEEDSSPATSNAIDDIKTIVGDKGYFIGSAVENKSLNENLNKEVKSVALIAVVVILLILCITTTSWFEPILFLLIMGVAIIINAGTNIFRGEISFVTQSVAALLQLAVSMDYSIFLMHSFEKERSKGVERSQAIENALKNSFKSVTACALTTIVGFIVLALMKFSIGLDMGLVLAKGIVISLATVLLLMPALILKFEKVVEKTSHKPFLPSFYKFGKFVYKIRYVVLIIVVLISVPCYIAKDMNDFSFGNSAVGSSEGTQVYEDEQAINKQFGRSNLLMALVSNTSPIKEKQLSQEIENLSYTKSVTSLANTVPEGIPESILPDSIISKLHTDNYSRILIYIKTSDESEVAFKCSDEIKSIVKKYYPENSYLIGATPCTQDIKFTITSDYDFVGKLSILGVALVILLSFKSLLLALMVIIPIEFAIYINMAFPYLTGDNMVYIGYIIVSCIQLGATVDYAILMVNNYLNRRKSIDKKEAAIKAIADTTSPVLTSGLILSCAGFILGKTSSISAIAGMGQLIGRGAILAVILSLCMLPTLLVLVDKPIMKHINKANKRRKQRLQKIYFRKGKLKNQNKNIA